MFTDQTVTNTEKQEKIIEYVRNLKAIEDAMEPYKESKRELRKDFRSNGWLTRDEMSTITRAYRMLRKNESIDELVSAYESLRGAK
tara:strand:- start:10537 stop:10794 length:258 start_codon:yes stop_codon:yes gene_type:complete